MKVYTKNLSEPWFSLVGLGIKSVEGRLHKGDFAFMKVGDIIEFSNEDMIGKKRTFRCQITRIQNYLSFESYLSKETLKKCLPTPGIRTIQEGVAVYHQFYQKSDEEKYGIVAIEITKIQNNNNAF